jgi:hypothetical protein
VIAMEQRGDERCFLRQSLARGWFDVIALHRIRTVMTVANSVVAALIVFIATGKPSSWWIVLASPAVLVLTYVVILAANLLGWNRLWRSAWSVDPAADGHGPRLNVWLRPKDRTVKLGGPDVVCWVRAPCKKRFKNGHHKPRAVAGQSWAMYPDDFEDAPPLAAGTHTMTWREEIRTGAWREVLSYRAKVVLPASVVGAVSQNDAVD